MIEHKSSFFKAVAKWALMVAFVVSTSALTQPQQVPHDLPALRSIGDPARGLLHLTIEKCRRWFPALLARADRELEPWRAMGITRQMLDQVWKCRGSDSQRRLGGLVASIRNGRATFEVNPGTRQSLTGRAKLISAMISSVAADFYPLPDVDFAMATGDHLYQSAGDRGYNGTFNNSLAPVLVAYRLQRDSGSVAAPDWTFYRHTFSPPPGGNAWDIDGHAARIMRASELVPFGARKPKLFFAGGSTHGDLRDVAWLLSVTASEKWGAIGLMNGAAAKRLRNVTPDPGNRFTFTSHEDHCRYRYLLNLAGNGGSNRFKYLFFCNSTVVSPKRNGGLGGAGPGNEFEEFFYHRLVPGEHFVEPPSVDDLPAAVRKLRRNDATARRIAAKGVEWAILELTQQGASCYWAHLIHLLAKLQRKGGAAGPRALPPPYTQGLRDGVCVGEHLKIL